MLSLILMSNYIHGQKKSKEALGNAIVESILSNNVDSFKSLLLPRNVVLKLKENRDLENVDKEQRDSLMVEFGNAYDEKIIPIRIIGGFCKPLVTVLNTNRDASAV